MDLGSRVHPQEEPQRLSPAASAQPRPGFHTGTNWKTLVELEAWTQGRCRR